MQFHFLIAYFSLSERLCYFTFCSLSIAELQTIYFSILLPFLKVILSSIVSFSFRTLQLSKRLRSFTFCSLTKVELQIYFFFHFTTFSRSHFYQVQFYFLFAYFSLSKRFCYFTFRSLSIAELQIYLFFRLLPTNMKSCFNLRSQFLSNILSNRFYLTSLQTYCILEIGPLF